MKTNKFNFNQDLDCFSVIHGSKVAIFSMTSEGAPKHKSTIQWSSDIHIATMLHKTNIIGIVAGTRRNKLELYDDIKAGVVLEIEFFCPIARVQLRKDVIVTLTTEKLFFHTLRSPPQLLYEHSVQATLLCISIHPHILKVATETAQPGQLHLLNVSSLLPSVAPISSSYSSSNSFSSPTNHSNEFRTTPVLPSNQIHMFKAHHSTIKAITMSSDGTYLVSASDRGTLVRIWNTTTTQLIHEFRRGMDAAALHALAFNASCTRLVLSSDKGTIHIFNLPSPSSSSSSSKTTTPLSTSHSSFLQNPTSGHTPPTSSKTQSFHLRKSSDPLYSMDPSTFTSNSLSTPNLCKNKKSQWSFLTPWLPSYFGSEWSFASFHLPFYHEPLSSQMMVPRLEVSFLQTTEKVLVCCEDGRLVRFAFDLRKGGKGIEEGCWQLDWDTNDNHGPVLELLSP